MTGKRQVLKGITRDGAVGEMVMLFDRSRHLEEVWALLASGANTAVLLTKRTGQAVEYTLATAHSCPVCGRDQEVGENGDVCSACGTVIAGPAAEDAG